MLSRVIPELVFQVWADSELENGVLGLARFWPPEIIMAESAYIEAVNGRGRGRWVAAHELGHIWLMHGSEAAFRGPAKSTVRIPTRFSAEFQADEFAAELLMPAGSCRTMTITEITRTFGVSPSTAERRLAFIRSR
jgi:Zn-dependent peptidase ImmA (M78 family)